MTAAEVMRPLVEEEVPEKIKFYRSLQNAEVGVRTPYVDFDLPLSDDSSLIGARSFAASTSRHRSQPGRHTVSKRA